MITYAHRGVCAAADEENTMDAFERALDRGMNFECDVRMSIDGVPVIVHDHSLMRTHGVDRRVQFTRAADLEALGVPTLDDVLRLLARRGGRVVLDLKVAPTVLMRETLRLMRERRVRASDVTFLVWTRLTSRPTSATRLLRAVGYTFHTTHPFVDGVACKYDGSYENVACIERALERNMEVNVWPPDATKLAELIRRYGARPGCTITADAA